MKYLFTQVPSGNYFVSVFEKSNPDPIVMSFGLGSVLIPRLGPEEIFTLGSILQSIACIVGRLLYISSTV